MSFTRKEYDEEGPRKSYTPAQAKVKIAAFCAYQERCQKEVRDKLYSYGLSSSDVEEVLTTMILEGFINEERFAKAFVSGKFRIKKWGKMRIAQELKRRVNSENLVRMALQEIDEEEYWNTLLHLAEKKLRDIQEVDPFKKKLKLHQFLLYKGYEHDVIQSALEELQLKGEL
ncbi:MAG TPA: regulatory protein RecX [Cyclobacteriaceae bacterium]|nr:regulatory protein RecX [Cyclobacteriaceae bacterium]